MLRTAAVVRARHHVETGQSAEADVAEAQASVAATVPRAARLWTLGLPCAVCTAPAWSGVRVGVGVGVGLGVGLPLARVSTTSSMSGGGGSPPVAGMGWRMDTRRSGSIWRTREALVAW